MTFSSTRLIGAAVMLTLSAVPQNQSRTAAASPNSPALLAAVRSGDSAQAQELLSRGANPNTEDEFGTPVLSTAVQNRRWEIVRMLLKHRANPNAKNDEGFTPLMVAASGGDAAVTSLLIDNGAALNTQSQWGTTALMMAAQAGHKQVVDLLLAKGADTKLVNQHGETAGVLARNFRRVEIAAKLGAPVLPPPQEQKPVAEVPAAKPAAPPPQPVARPIVTPEAAPTRPDYEEFTVGIITKNRARDQVIGGSFQFAAASAKRVMYGLLDAYPDGGTRLQWGSAGVVSVEGGGRITPGRATTDGQGKAACIGSCLIYTVMDAKSFAALTSINSTKQMAEELERQAEVRPILSGSFSGGSGYDTPPRDAVIAAEPPFRVVVPVTVKTGNAGQVMDWYIAKALTLVDPAPAVISEVPLDAAWQQARTEDSLRGYVRFLAAHPSGRSHPEFRPKWAAAQAKARSLAQLEDYAIGPVMRLPSTGAPGEQFLFLAANRDPVSPKRTLVGQIAIRRSADNRTMPGVSVTGSSGDQNCLGTCAGIMTLSREQWAEMTRGVPQDKILAKLFSTFQSKLEHRAVLLVSLTPNEQNSPSLAELWIDGAVLIHVGSQDLLLP